MACNRKKLVSFHDLSFSPIVKSIAYLIEPRPALLGQCFSLHLEAGRYEGQPSPIQLEAIMLDLQSLGFKIVTHAATFISSSRNISIVW